ncbi:MAG: 16S rRNA (guanine(527)-N(7))-methyltransferase RsmG [Deltaproteobacteria bacterium]|nr:16S rRNA (guanine(527)-N(7))-methyltransferase RsmG [Deltaproteobacteria bacterium]
MNQIEDTINVMKEALVSASQKLDIHLGKREFALFEEYYRELLLWNKKMSLVSVKSPLDVPVKHLIDSLTVVPLIDDEKRSLLDIGSGAGFPGIPIKVIRNSLAVTLLDSSRKKISFLKNIVRRLNLEDTQVINKRVELFAEEIANDTAFDVVISRATFKLPVLIEKCSRFVSKKGILIAMKGKEIDREVKEAIQLCEKTGMRFTACQDITLPVSGDPRKIVLFERHIF